MDIEEIVRKHIDGKQPCDPYWINLNLVFNSENHGAIKKAISDSLNEYFKKNGTDAVEDFTSFTSRTMKLETARNALQFALDRNKVLLYRIPKSHYEWRYRDIYFKADNLIDGVGSLETDGRENDPVTGETLNCSPVFKPFVIDELNSLVEQSKMDLGDWLWIDLVINSYGEHDQDVTGFLLKVINKHAA